jgi:hypothetical protein
MIPHLHENETQPSKQAPSPLEEERTSIAAPWWRTNWLVRITGALVLFVVGLVGSTATTALGIGFFAVLGAAWLNSWWACLVVPVALLTGSAMRQLLSGGFEFDSMLLITLFAFCGAALGTAFFKQQDLWRWIRSKGFSRPR